MAFAWFICPYERADTPVMPVRRAAVEGFKATILADGGSLAYTEILGNHALVKVRASPATLTAINQAPGCIRIPAHVALEDTLGDLTGPQRQAILDKLEALGYPLAEIQGALPANWQQVTLRQVLRFAARRRLKPRYDSGTDTIILDGPVQPVTSVEFVADAVT